MLVVLVNGLPGAGKTTLARLLARELGLPLLSKDAIKETLADVLPQPGLPPREWSNLLGGASSETLWTLLADCPAGAVVEGPWLAHVRQFAIAGLARAGVREVQEVWCDVPLAVAQQRFAERAPGRHVIHFDCQPGAEPRWDLWSRMAQPVRAGFVHHVDAAEHVDVVHLAGQIRERSS